MPADYNIPMTDAQITEALQLMVERVSEGWAQETYDGSPVGSGSPYYHKSSKWWATQAADAAARAEAAVPAGTAGAVFFDRAQTLATAQQEQARQNIKAGGSNRNLLPNPWFTINQRKATSGIGDLSYCSDRWRAYNCSWVVNSDKTISLTFTGSGAGILTIIPFEADMVGKNYTLSVMLADGTVYSGTVVAPSSGVVQTSIFNNLRMGLSVTQNGLYQITLYLRSGTATIKAMKLEKGSVSTLANDDPPNENEELENALYIFRRINNHLGYAQGVLLGIAVTATQIDVPNITGGKMMYKTPNISFSGTISISGAGTPTFTSLTRITDVNGYIGMRITGTGFTAGNVYKINLGANSYIDISADL